MIVDDKSCATPEGGLDLSERSLDGRQLHEVDANGLTIGMQAHFLVGQKPYDALGRPVRIGRRRLIRRGEHLRQL
ncbi:MAG TPA: hypothetical protein VE597_01880 [Geminicoccaceae bacterium]|nr:hypothetical protein [Geminicoccaceae bacterium]